MCHKCAHNFTKKSTRFHKFHKMCYKVTNPITEGYEWVPLCDINKTNSWKFVSRQKSSCNFLHICAQFTTSQTHFTWSTNIRGITKFTKNMKISSKKIDTIFKKWWNLQIHKIHVHGDNLPTDTICNLQNVKIKNKNITNILQKVSHFVHKSAQGRLEPNAHNIMLKNMSQFVTKHEIYKFTKTHKSGQPYERGKSGPKTWNLQLYKLHKTKMIFNTFVHKSAN